MSSGVASFVRRQDRDGVRVLTIDNPPVNALAAPVVAQLCDELDAAFDEPAVAALVITGASNCFIAGADITRLESIARGQRPAIADGPTLLDAIARLERSAKPCVAAIDGFALGGGLELSLACHTCVGTKRARLGLPELKLGLIPGAGGTQRLPRIVGVDVALEMMLGGKELRGQAGKDAGILQAVVADDELLDEACKRARTLQAEPDPLVSNLTREDQIESIDAAESCALEMRKRFAKRYRNQGQMEACIEAVLHGLRHGPTAGLEHERQLFLGLLDSDAARGLIHVFFAERAVGKADLPKPRELSRVGVVGGGTMGRGIATALLTAGLEVTLVEGDEARAGEARQHICEQLARDAARGRATTEQSDARQLRLTASAKLSSLANAEFVIEAVNEDADLKRSLIRGLSEVLGDDVPIATNTSTLSLSRLHDAGVPPERIVGMHFFSPAHIMKLVEVIRDDRSSPAAIADSIRLTKRMRKTPVVVRSCPGFLLNRIFMPYSQACGLLIDRGVDPYVIDAALEDFGMPMGPCRVSDLAGIDVGLKAGAVLDGAYAGRAYRSALRQLLADAGRLGEKSGAGHYRYEGSRAQPDDALQGYIEQAREIAGRPEPIAPSARDIVDHLLFPVINEALRTLSEGIVSRPGDVDVAAILGYGFPAYRGGPLRWAETRGLSEVLQQLSEWHGSYQVGLFRPSDALRRAAQQGSMDCFLD